MKIYGPDGNQVGILSIDVGHNGVIYYHIQGIGPRARRRFSFQDLDIRVAVEEFLTHPGGD